MIEMFGEGPIELDPRYYTTSTSIIDDEMIKNEVVPSEIRTQNITEDKIPFSSLPSVISRYKVNISHTTL